jgi:O-antigen ligase
MPIHDDSHSSQIERGSNSVDESSLSMRRRFAWFKRAKRSAPSAIPTRIAIVIFLLAIVFACLFANATWSLSGSLHNLQWVPLSVEWMLLSCPAAWCGCFIFLTFRRGDLPLIGLLLIAITGYFVGRVVSWKMEDAVILFAGVTVGRGIRFVLEECGRWKIVDGQRNLQIVNRNSAILNFLAGLIVLLAFSSWWHLDIPDYSYRGRRWAGPWDSPNIYGMLMGAGVVLAIGLLFRSADEKDLRGFFHYFLRRESAKSAKENIPGASWGLFLRIILIIAAGMMAVGLLFSYSRGAWVATMVGLLYLAKTYSKFEWRRLKLFLFSVFCFLLLIICLFWNVPHTAPWYLQRMDFSRGSVQHRIAAWEASVEMMRDHPFGVGWNKAVQTYKNDYSPPEKGVSAITTNDYLMLGTQLGFPGLGCFVAYIVLCLRHQKPEVQNPESEKITVLAMECRTPESSQASCRAGALALAVSFWFDGGLFRLATGSLFWILLELGGDQGRARYSVRAGAENQESSTQNPPSPTL